MLETVIFVIIRPRVKVTLLWETEITATGSLMVILMATGSEPPELLAHIVYDTVVMLTVGIPLIVPLFVLKTRPEGKAGCTSQVLTTAPPLLIMVTGLMRFRAAIKGEFTLKLFLDRSLSG